MMLLLAANLLYPRLMPRLRLIGLVIGFLLYLPLAAYPQVMISEFMASNGQVLADEEGEYPDWIELYNSGAGSVNLEGWYLTDNASNLTKWRIPAVSIPPKGFVLVFASGKDRKDPSATLHANFSLSASGEYLALIASDGVTVVSAFAPQFPEQFRDVSYGIGQQVTTNIFLPERASVRVLIPADDTLGHTWIQREFNHTTWLSGPTGVGYETEIPGFAVHNHKASILVDSLAAADSVIADPARRVGTVSENAAFLDYFNSGGQGHYGNNLPFPGHAIGVDVDDFVIEATAIITIPSAGSWTFGVNSDDGFRLNIGSFEISHPSPRGPDDTLGVFTVPAAGDYPLRLVFYERGGGAGLELFAAAGSRATWDSTNFRLVGDTARGGLAVRSVPVSGGGGGSLGALIGTDVEPAMKGRNGSAYLRLPFDVGNAGSIESLTLRMKYNDGFFAYLNGQEVARRNAPTTPAWNSMATSSRSTGQSLVYEDINLSDRLGLLTTGANVLAIHGLNRTVSDPSFLILPQLVEYKVEEDIRLYFTTPSPGSLNGEGVLGFLAAPRPSAKAGFYDAPFDLELTSPTPGIAIRYTTNGTVPTLSNGFTYSSPLRIGGTTTLRAAAFQDRFESSPSVTRTFLFPDDIVRQSPNGEPPPGWPSSWGANVVDYGMDPDIVNHPTYGPTIKDDLKTIPSFSIVMDLRDLFDPATGIFANPGQDGRAWERPCSFELLHPDGTEGFQTPAGIRIRGGFSRSTSNPKHAFRLFFRSEYGAGKLVYPLFGDGGTDTFDKIDLRTFQNYSWSFQGDPGGIFVRDQFNRDLQLAMGHHAERGEFYHLYINGHYWGIFNTCERPEASYGETYFGGRREDYDTVKVEAGPYTINATDGNLDAWTRLYNLARAGFSSIAAYQFVQGNNPDGTRNPAYENLVDIPNLIDYMLIILFGGNLDAPISNFLGNTRPNNFYGLRDRTGPHGFRFFVHDAEHTLLNLNESRVGPYPAGDSSILYSNPQWIWQKLQANPEFRLRVADHVHRHFFNDGVLTAPRALELFLHRVNQLDRAVVGESARWGDAKRTTPLTRADWLNAVNNVRNNYLPQRPGVVLNQLRNAGLYPAVVAPAFNQHGGHVDPGFNLVISAPTGTIYYTLDGSDPRLLGGTVSPRALPYTGSISLGETVEVNARVLSGGTWSAMNSAGFTLIQTFSDLFITEIMYHPTATETWTSDQLEFIELKNVGPEPLDLSGVAFTDGIRYTFPAGTQLDPGAFVVLVADPVAFASHYAGIPFDDVYSGRLSNSGERLTLSHAVGTSIFSVRYADVEPWPIAADGAGFSLVPLNPNLNPNPDDAANWRASTAVGGSPGRDDPSGSIPAVVVNEALTHTDLPFVDVIELHNPNPFAVDVGHWYLTDRRTTPKKYQIPAPTLIPAGGYILFDESQFNSNPGVSPSFSLNSQGEEVYLYSGDASGELTGYSHGFAFGAAANGVSFGRHVISTGEAHYTAQSRLTLGAVNAGPRVGPVVINEILYHPAAGDAEFIELKNITSNPVPLYHPDHPDLTWRLNGVGYSFPPGTQMAAQGLLLIVSGDPDVFRAKHGVPAQVPILGPFPGVLQDGGERLQLLRPDNPDIGEDGLPVVPEIVVDEIRYSNRAPWPAEASGSGASIERMVATAYGNDPINWRTSPGAPSAGLPNTGNRPPQVDAGADQSLTTSVFPLAVSLNGSVTDDGLPNPPGFVTLTWSQVSGPGNVWFDSSVSPSTTVHLPGVGIYALRLTASDSELQSSSDLIVTVTRTTSSLTLLAQGSVWNYRVTGVELPSNWMHPAFDDSNWPRGPAKLGYGDGDEATVIGFGPDPNNKYVTTFFRRTFAVSNAASVSALKVGLRRDDGGIVYLNGTEVFRSNMPEGDISFTTLASNVVGGAEETTFYEQAVDPTLLVEGANVLAVRIHQVNLSSSDLGFDLYCTGTAFPANTAPTVNAGPDQAIVLPNVALLSGQVSDDGLPIPPGQVTSTWSKLHGPGTVTFANPYVPRTAVSFSLPGTYTLRLTANDGASIVTDAMTMTVTGDTFEDWKSRHFFGPELLDPALSGEDADPDLDGHTNYEEYLADTDPRDAESILQIVEITLLPGDPMNVEIRFDAVAGRSYSLQSRHGSAFGWWQNLVSIPTQTETGVVSLMVSYDTAARFYRIVTPQQLP
jgi:hypothetical protein